MDQSVEILFKLLRVALEREAAEGLSSDVDWRSVIDLSFTQGVAALAVDGLQKVCEAQPEMELALDLEELEDAKYEWFGDVFSCEEDAAKRADAAGKLARLWAAEGIPTMVLKGAAFAQYYPNPNHRYSCDLDLFIGEKWEAGCRVLERQGVDICYEVYKDAEFHIDGVYVECHRYLMPIRGNETLRRMEMYLRGLLADGLASGAGGLLMPPLMFNALFCIEHARGHLLQGPLTLRQVCDWMLIRRQPLDWDEFRLRCSEFGLMRFARLMDELADLIEGKLRYEELSSVDRRVVDEMLGAGLASKGKSRKAASFFQRRVHLLFTLIGNGWKYREFNDVSMPVALFRQVWTHFFDKEVRL